jgi:hypothetical protein
VTLPGLTPLPQPRAHLEATGAAPRDEFGPLADYARRLAEPEPARRDPWWRTRPATMLSHAAGIVTGVCAFADLPADGHVWAAWLVALPVTAAVAWQPVTTARGHFREQRAT